MVNSSETFVCDKTIGNLVLCIFNTLKENFNNLQHFEYLPCHQKAHLNMAYFDMENTQLMQCYFELVNFHIPSSLIHHQSDNHSGDSHIY